VAVINTGLVPKALRPGLAGSPSSPARLQLQSPQGKDKTPRRLQQALLQRSKAKKRKAAKA
jgi:hypothetical protein